MERGDAIDLLVCMVEQALNFDPVENKGSRDVLCEKCQVEYDNRPSSRYNICGDCLEKMKIIVNSTGADASETGQSPPFNEQLRTRAVATLLRSHEFVLELKRSSLSANKWLESIGRTKNGNADSDGADGGPNQSLEVVALRARLNSAENTISNKDNELMRLNEELSKCRAEIGRLNLSLTQVCGHKHCLFE